MGEADKERRRAERQRQREQQRAQERVDEAARKKAAKAGRKAAAQIPPPDKKKPQPDTGPRNQPCNKALAHKPHGAHRYRSGNQQMHCPGVQ